MLVIILDFSSQRKKENKLYYDIRHHEMEMDDFELEDKEEHLEQKIDAVDYQLRNPA